MNKITEFLAFLTCFSLLGCTASRQILTGNQTSRNLTKEITYKVELDYLLYLPEDYNSDNKFPLLLFLHGAGERGNDIEKVKMHGPPKLIEEGKDFPFIVVSPQCPEGQWWNISDLNILLNEIVNEYSVDTNRIYVTGLSMGGFGTWEFAIKYPDRFAAIVPICGGGNAHLVRNIKDVPVWVFHGARDQVVPIERSQEMVDALKKAGGNVKFTIYPDATHDSWTETYNNPEVFEWLLSKSR